jgi:hypothetical protein
MVFNYESVREEMHILENRRKKCSYENALRKIGEKM